MSNPPPDERRSPLTIATLALCAALLAGPLLAWLPWMGSRFPGIEEVDYYGTLWFYGLAASALASGDPGQLLSADLFFHPFGKDLYLHTGANVLDAVLAAPLRWLLGPVAGFNAFLLLGAAFNAWAFSRLARHFTADRLAVGISSLWFVASPYALYEFAEGRPTQAIMGLIPLFLLFTWRSGEAPGWRNPTLAGLTLALLGFQYWYYAFFGGLLCLAHGLWRAATSVDRLGVLMRHAGIAAVSMALTLPAAWPLAAAAASGEAPGLLDTAAWSATAVDPVTRGGHDIALQTWQPWLRETGFYLVDDGEGKFIGHQRLLSWVLLALAALGLARPGWLARGPLLAMTATALWIATGPMIVVGGQWLPDPLYQAAADALGFMARLWWPGRAFAFLVPLLTLLAAMGLTWAARDRRLQAGLAGLATLLWAMDLRTSGLWPMPSWDASIPAAYQCLGDDTIDAGAGAVIELPYGWTQAHLYYQTAHWRPILGGMLENNPTFSPPEALALREENRFLVSAVAAVSASSAPEDWTAADMAADKAALHDLGYRYVVLQKDALALRGGAEGMAANLQRTRLRRYRRALVKLLGAPVYEDARAAIYAPWGDPTPCDVEALPPDEATRPPRDSPTSSVKPLETRPLTPWL